MRSVVSERGQMVIPKPLREKLGLRAGQGLECREEQGRLIVVKSEPHDSVDSAYGILHLGRSTDEVVAALRGPDGATKARKRRVQSGSGRK